MLQGLDDKVCIEYGIHSDADLPCLQVVPPDQGNHSFDPRRKFPKLTAPITARTLIKKIEDAGGHVEAVFYEGRSPC